MQPVCTRAIVFLQHVGSPARSLAYSPIPIALLLHCKGSFACHCTANNAGRPGQCSVACIAKTNLRVGFSFCSRTCHSPHCLLHNSKPAIKSRSLHIVCPSLVKFAWWLAFVSAFFTSHRIPPRIIPCFAPLRRRRRRRRRHLLRCCCYHRCLARVHSFACPIDRPPVRPLVRPSRPSVRPSVRPSARPFVRSFVRSSIRSSSPARPHLLTHARLHVRTRARTLWLNPDRPRPEPEPDLIGSVQLPPRE